MLKRMFNLPQGDILDIYDRAKDPGRARNPAAVPVDFSSARVNKPEKWTYDLLVESQPLQQYIQAVVGRARREIEEIQKTSATVS